MQIDKFQLEQTQKRYDERQAQRARNQRLIDQKRYLDVDTPDRVQKFLDRRGIAVDIDRAPSFERASTVMAGETAGLAADMALERILGTSDLMGVAFLEEGLRVSRTVARIWVNVSGGQPAGFGTGFMVSPRLLMTNHHVLRSAASARSSLAEFEFQRRSDGTLTSSTCLRARPRHVLPQRPESSTTPLRRFQASELERAPAFGFRRQSSLGGRGQGDCGAVGQHDPAPQRRAQAGQFARKPDHRRVAELPALQGRPTLRRARRDRRSSMIAGKLLHCVVRASLSSRTVRSWQWMASHGAPRWETIASNGLRTRAFASAG